LSAAQEEPVSAHLGERWETVDPPSNQVNGYPVEQVNVISRDQHVFAVRAIAKLTLPLAVCRA